MSESTQPGEAKIYDIDVALVLDITGSMESWIDSARRTLLSSFSSLQETYPGSRFRLACVCYRDIGDNEPFVIIPFTEDISSVQTQLQSVVASGGDDTAEDVAGALKNVSELHWNENRDAIKIILWVTDAPAHGNKYHSVSLSDRFPKGDPNGIDPYEQVRSLAQRGIDMTIFRVNQSLDKMIEQFANAYNEYSDTTFIVLDVEVKTQKNRIGEREYDDYTESSTICGSSLTSGFIDLATYDVDERYDYGSESSYKVPSSSFDIEEEEDEVKKDILNIVNVNRVEVHSYDDSYVRAAQEAISSAIEKLSKRK